MLHRLIRKTDREPKRMPMTIKNAAEIERMRAAGRVVVQVHERLREAVQPGVTTGELDGLARDALAELLTIRETVDGWYRRRSRGAHHPASPTARTVMEIEWRMRREAAGLRPPRVIVLRRIAVLPASGRSRGQTHANAR